MLKNRLNKGCYSSFQHSLFLSHSSRYRYYGRILSKLSLLQHLTQLRDFFLLLLFCQQINFVKCHDNTVHKNLTESDTLSCLCLYQFLTVNDQHHNVNDRGTTDHSLHQPGVPRAVYQSKLQEVNSIEILPFFFPKPIWHRDDEC